MVVRKTVEKFIDKGADVKPTKDRGFKNVLIRIPESILSQLDTAVDAKPWLTRTQWVVEAIHEKLKNDLKVE